jgi:aconitase A
MVVNVNKIGSDANTQQIMDTQFAELEDQVVDKNDINNIKLAFGLSDEQLSLYDDEIISRLSTIADAMLDPKSPDAREILESAKDFFKDLYICCQQQAQTAGMDIEDILLKFNDNNTLDEYDLDINSITG